MPEPCNWCRLDLHGHGENGCPDCPACEAIRGQDLTENDALDAAIHIVALRVLVHQGADVDDAWGLYPEIGERDWRAVTDRVAWLADQIDPEYRTYIDAYSLLERRAIAWERENGDA